MDSILMSHNNGDQLKTITTNVEWIFKNWGFELNPWILSGQSQRKEHSDELDKCQEINMVLLNQMSNDDNKVVGLGYVT